MNKMFGYAIVALAIGFLWAAVSITNSHPFVLGTAAAFTFFILAIWRASVSGPTHDCYADWAAGGALLCNSY